MDMERLDKISAVVGNLIFDPIMDKGYELTGNTEELEKIRERFINQQIEIDKLRQDTKGV